MLVLNSPKGRPSNAPEVVDYILAHALKAGASDIHLSVNLSAGMKEPILLRFRVNGRLQVLRSDFIGGLYKEALARIKVLAGLDTTDMKSPQDGQIDVETPEGQVILRVSTVPGLDVEDLVIRIQRNRRSNYNLNDIRISEPMRSRLTQLVQQKSGLIILNGPAGSGKTTTIYSIIGALAGPERKIITAEDPVEARLPYVSHNQVTEKADFASLCRAFMRQDADVIFVGEVRDQESAEAAIQLAQTGHLVLTTLHTRDSIGVISRLEALNVHSNMIASALIGSLSQRLIPVLCQECRIPYRPDEYQLALLNRKLAVPGNATFFMSGPGCPKCSEGFVGRIPVFELFCPDFEISEMISRGALKSDILAAAKAGGMTQLAHDVLIKVYSGITDLRSVSGYVFAPEARTATPAAPTPVREQSPPAAPVVIPAVQTTMKRK